MLTISCLFLSRAHGRNKGKSPKVNKRLKGCGKLRKHAHAAILPTDAFKLQILYKKGASSFVVNLLVPAQRITF